MRTTVGPHGSENCDQTTSHVPYFSLNLNPKKKKHRKGEKEEDDDEEAVAP